MRSQLFEEDIGESDELGEYGRRRRSASRYGADGSAARRIRRMPYDYVAKFPLTGINGHKVNAIINVSAEAWFICTSLGYSLDESGAVPAPGAGTPGPVISSPLLRGGNLALTRFSLNLPNFVNTLDTTNVAAAVQGAVAAEQLNALQIQNIREALSFKYAIIDKGSGRELQNEPIHNLAGLGKPDGVRPFRELVVPYVFAPNSSILVEIEEILTLRGGTIHIDFQGYKEFR